PGFNNLYNSLIRDSIYSKVDALIHHFYFRLEGPRIEPHTADNFPTELDEIKSFSDFFIHERLPKIDEEYDKFFKMTENGKKLCITEFNLKNGILDGYLALWMNTFYHSSYMFETLLSFVDNKHNNDMVEFASKH